MTFLVHIVPANAGSGLARDAWLNLTLPSALVFVSDSSDGQRMVIGSRISWHWQDWPTGPRPFDLALAANPTTPDGANASVPMSLTSVDANGNHGPDVPVVLRASFVAPAIQLSISVNQERVATGKTFSYSLVLRNTGTTMTRTLWLVDSLGTSLRMFSYQSSVPVAGSSDLNWTFRTVQPQQVETVRLDIQVDAGVAVGTQVPNMFAAVYTNSNGTVIGYVQSGSVVITVVESASPLPYVFGTVAATGGAGGYLAYRRRRARIVEVFLISAEGGLLIDHLSRSLIHHKDPDVVSAMLSAVQDFVKDAFKLGEDRTLHQLEFGDYRIHLERGKHIFLAAVTAGGNGAATIKRLREVLDEIESKQGDSLRDWNGVSDALLGVTDIVRKRLLE